jgi:hypothetical protein
MPVLFLIVKWFEKIFFESVFQQVGDSNRWHLLP